MRLWILLALCYEQIASSFCFLGSFPIRIRTRTVSSSSYSWSELNAVSNVNESPGLEVMDMGSNNSSVPAFRRIGTYCVKGVTRRSGPLNEALVQLLQNTTATATATLSLQEANDLIAIGAVWAKMDALSEEELLSLYDDDDDMGSSSRALYAD